MSENEIVFMGVALVVIVCVFIIIGLIIVWLKRDLYWKEERLSHLQNDLCYTGDELRSLISYLNLEEVGYSHTFKKKEKKNV